LIPEVRAWLREISMFPITQLTFADFCGDEEMLIDAARNAYRTKVSEYGVDFADSWFGEAVVLRRIRRALSKEMSERLAYDEVERLLADISIEVSKKTLKVIIPHPDLETLVLELMEFRAVRELTRVFGLRDFEVDVTESISSSTHPGDSSIAPMTDLSVLEALAREAEDYISAWEKSGDVSHLMEAISIYRRLAELEPEKYTSDLAASLAKLANQLMRLKNFNEGIQAAQEAVDIYRRVGQRQANNDDTLLALGRTLNDLSVALENLGQHDRALPVILETVDIFSKLAQAKVGSPRDLAGALINLGKAFATHGRREDALLATERAVEMMRTLADRSDKFLSDLASALSNCALRLVSLGRNQEALAATREAVTIYRRLADVDSDAFLPELAGTLGNLSNLDESDDALVASQEAVGIFRHLVKDKSGAHLPDLAVSLNNLGVRLAGRERHSESLAIAEETVDIYRGLAAKHPQAFLPNLAACLNNCALELLEMKRADLALEASRESIDIYRELAQLRPDPFLPELARSMIAHSNALAALLRSEEAAHTAAEALRIVQPFAERYPSQYAALAHTIYVDALRYGQMTGNSIDEDLVERSGEVAADRDSVRDPIVWPPQRDG
jgi:tetratricopeptide (TPR) repeat protein